MAKHECVRLGGAAKTNAPLAAELGRRLAEEERWRLGGNVALDITDVDGLNVG